MFGAATKHLRVHVLVVQDERVKLAGPAGGTEGGEAGEEAMGAVGLVFSFLPQNHHHRAARTVILARILQFLGNLIQQKKNSLKSLM